MSGLSRALAALCIAAGASADALAADANGDFAIRGAGAQSCAALVRAWDERTDDLALYAGWIEGYLTGLNQHLDDTFEIAPWQTAASLLALVRQACANADAQTGVMAVTARLIRELAPARLKAKSPMVGVAIGDFRTALYADTVEAMRLRLRAEGFEPGPEGAPFGGLDSAALGAFQKARGLEETAAPDQRTLFALFVRAAPSSQTGE
jgi:hypothetical protein